MSQTYYTILTKLGAELLANATSLGIPLKLTSMAVGDGNGSVPKPIATQTALIHEVRRAAINSLSVDKNNPNQIIAEQVIPENEGGWFIHEIGLFDDKGNLIAVGNCPPTYKPRLAEGSGRTQVIRMIIIIDNIDSVELKIDPSVVLATREYVDNLIATKTEAHEKSTNHPTATTKSKGFVQLSSAINSTDENQAATPLAVKQVNDLLQSISVKFHCYEKETRVFSGDKKQYIFVRDDGVSGFVGADGKIKWGFDANGSLGLGTVPVSKISDLTFNSSTSSTAEDQVATPLAVKNTYDLATSANHKINDLEQCFSYSDVHHQAEIHSRNQINHLVVRDDDLVGLYSSREKDFLWFFSGDRLHKGFVDVSQVLTQQKHEENGFVKLPSGIILQWLTAVTDNNGCLDARLPISFPNQLLSVFITEASAHDWIYEGLYSYGYSSNNSTCSTIRVHSRCAVKGGNVHGNAGRFSLLAIGC